MRRSVQVGSRVRILKVPPTLEDRDELKTKSVFEKCIGNVFVVQGFQVVDGLQEELLELIVGDVTGSPGETIWIEAEYIELLEDLDDAARK